MLFNRLPTIGNASTVRWRSTSCLGSNPYTVKRGATFVVLFGIELNANFAYGRNLSHCLGWLLANNLNKFPKLLLTTFVCPSDLGDSLIGCAEIQWGVHSSFQKIDRNFVSLSEVILLGTPCIRTTSLKNKFATRFVSKVFLQAMKWAIFENLSTTTNMESQPFWILGSPLIKSMDTSTHGFSSVGKGIYNPVFCVVLLSPFPVGRLHNSVLSDSSRLLFSSVWLALGSRTGSSSRLQQLKLALFFFSGWKDIRSPHQWGIHPIYRLYRG